MTTKTNTPRPPAQDEALRALDEALSHLTTIRTEPDTSDVRDGTRAAWAMEELLKARRHVADLVQGPAPGERLFTRAELEAEVRAAVHMTATALASDGSGAAPSLVPSPVRGEVPGDMPITITVNRSTLEYLFAAGNYGPPRSLSEALAMNALDHSAWLMDLVRESEDERRAHYAGSQMDAAQELISAVYQAERAAGRTAPSSTPRGDAATSPKASGGAA